MKGMQFTYADGKVTPREYDPPRAGLYEGTVLECFTFDRAITREEAEEIAAYIGRRYGGYRWLRLKCWLRRAWREAKRRK